MQVRARYIKEFVDTGPAVDLRLDDSPARLEANLFPFKDDDTDMVADSVEGQNGATREDVLSRAYLWAVAYGVPVQSDDLEIVKEFNAWVTKNVESADAN